MNLLLIVREEIACLVILIFIVLYSRLYKMGKDQGSFLRICIFAIGHVIFDLITVITVNRQDSCPPTLNALCHIVFYLFALLFSFEFLCYTVTLGYSRKVLRIVRHAGLATLLAYVAALPFLPPIEYQQSGGTASSTGVVAFVGYGIAMLFFIASIVVVLLRCKHMNKYAVGALLPMLVTAIAAEIIQIAVPEMLFTGGAVTMITVGFFFSLENPIAVLRHKVFIDTMTGVKSRHSYDAAIEKMEKRFAAGTQYGMVFCDINDLKAVNDAYGHPEGDAYIAGVAQILLAQLKNAETIYRMGGDEFLAIYQDKSLALIRGEIDAVIKACAQESENRAYSVSLAIGCAVSDRSDKTLRNVLRKADYSMYADKIKIKQQRAYRFGDANQPDISGLSDRMFDALANTEPERLLFITNLTTNVTRLSLSAVRFFALDAEFLANGLELLQERVHPQDCERMSRYLNAIYSGKQERLAVECRVRRSDECYVSCRCTGTVLKGKNGEPDLFAGTLSVCSEKITVPE